MKQKPDFYLYFTLDNGEGYELGIVVESVEQDIESHEWWPFYEITSVDNTRPSRFKDQLKIEEAKRLDEEVLQAIWEDSEADRVAVMSANLED